MMCMPSHMHNHVHACDADLVNGKPTWSLVLQPEHEDIQSECGNPQLYDVWLRSR